jgi:hypothetical protein
MADFFKGLTGGFQSGLQLGQAVRQRQMEDALAQESAKYGVTEGAYGPELQANIDQVRALQAQNPDQAAQYEPAIAELTRRQGLTAPDYSVASGPTNFASRQEARQAAAPMRTEGLANVYRQYGDVAKADELEARAFEQQRAMAREGRESEAFKTAQKEAGLRIGDAERVAAANKRSDDFAAFAAERPDMSVAELKDAAFKQFKFSPEQWQKTVATRLGIDEAEIGVFKNNVRKKLQGKNLAQLGSLYNTDPDFDDKTDLAIVPGKGGAVTLNFIDKASGRVASSQSFKSEAMATEYLNKQATEPETMGTWMMSLRGKEADIAAKEAAASKDRALGGLYAQGGAGAGKGTLKQKVADFKEVYGRDPTEAEKGVLAGLVAKDPNKPEFNAKDYSATIKNFTEAGFSQTDALIKADQLYGRGPNTAGEDAALAKANAAKGGAPATATKPAVGLTPQQREQVKPAPQAARAPTTLDAIQSANLEAVGPLAAQFNQARAQLIQASQSKDPNAIAYYMNQQNALRKQLESEVSRRFGNNAPTVMQQLAGSM